MIKVHEHTVEVVNKNDPLFEQLTMSNLLRHLERYAKEPHKYFEPLERSELQESFENGEHVLHRILHFGQMIVRDKVVFTDSQTMVTEVEHTEDYPDSRFTVKIETSENNDSIRLRFLYEEDTDEAPVEDIFLSLRRKAYEQKDKDMVEQIRRHARDLSALS